ncbi:transforming growth factor beta receptor type 3 isoform X2 [Hoplias malabaricus]|uniref:transforming growth factor beta receptor type 3 isoform X2 n=1 Tax=Hoplias malabaricus TaxID=27720 RepID=UPI003462110D
MLSSWCALLCLLLLRAGTAGGVKLHCAVSPVGVLHPVQAQLERFDAGPGCAAREGGAKETHVISVGKSNHGPDKQVTVVLRPLSYSRPVSRPVILVLSSQHALRWVLESEGLPETLHVLLQVSANSTVEFGSVPARVHSVPSLPWRARPLLQWTLQRHSTISSLTHSTRANRVYLRLGEDPSMPSVCHLQSLFLSHNYLASELQQQEANGCTPSKKPSDPEVHIIKLWSAGSGLCGSLQVEVSITLLPSVADAGWYNVVLVLSSAAPVNFALVTPGLRGHITVHSSHSVTPLYPPKPDLTMTTTIVPDLLLHPDLLAWADQNLYPFVSSYTEANLANRFVIKLKGGGTAQTVLEAKKEETRLRQWLSHEDDDDNGAEGSQEAISAQCMDGRLTVSVDKHILQALSLSVSAVTLRDPSCQAQSNGSHFLLAFPVISCGTEGKIERHSKEMQYKNTVLLWKRKPLIGLTNKTQWQMTDELTPLVIHFSCSAMYPTPASVPETSSSRPAGASWHSTDSEPLWFITPRAAPLLSMQLFVSEDFERRAVGPCIITANSRLYAEISSSSTVSGSLELTSCVVSPLSDPHVHSGWSIVQDFCPADPSFSLEDQGREERVSEKMENEEEEEDREDDGDQGEREEMDMGEEEEEPEDYEEGPFRKGSSQGRRREELRHKEEKKSADSRKSKLLKQNSDLRRGKKDGASGTVEERKRGMVRLARRKKERSRVPRLRFSFVLRPVFNNSIQFLHCSLQLCGEGPPGVMVERVCPQGPSIPALIHASTGQKCEYRNLSRPVLVTYSPSVGLAGLLPPPAGQHAQKSAVTRTEMSRHSSSDSDTVPVLVIVFAAFLLGISLMGALWCIYSCTGKPTAGHRGSYLDTTEHNSSSWNQLAQVDQASSSV